MSAGWYLYAIVAHDRVPPSGLTGIGEGELTTVVSGGLAAVTGSLTLSGPQRTTENVLRHSAVVEALQADGPVLPVRFGTVLPDRATVVRALAEHQPGLLSDLARLGDKVEFGLIVLWDRPPGADEDSPHDPRNDDGDDRGPGTRYLRARLAASQRDHSRRVAAQTIAREIEDALGTRVLDRRSALAPTDRLALRAAFLIEPSQFDGCRQMIAAMRERRPDLRIVVSGPWSPYSFVNRDHSGDQSSLGQSLNQMSQLLALPPPGGERAEQPAMPARA